MTSSVVDPLHSDSHAHAEAGPSTQSALPTQPHPQHTIASLDPNLDPTLHAHSMNGDPHANIDPNLTGHHGPEISPTGAEFVHHGPHVNNPPHSHSHPPAGVPSEDMQQPPDVDEEPIASGSGTNSVGTMTVSVGIPANGSVSGIGMGPGAIAAAKAKVRAEEAVGILISRRTRSPTPPRALFRSTTGKGVAFTDEDVVFLIKLLEWKRVQGKSDMVTFWKEIAQKVRSFVFPTHTPSLRADSRYGYVGAGATPFKGIVDEVL